MQSVAISSHTTRTKVFSLLLNNEPTRVVACLGGGSRKQISWNGDRPVSADDRPGRLSDPQVKTDPMSSPADVKKKHHYGHHHHGSSGGGGNAAGAQQQNKKPKLEGQSQPTTGGSCWLVVI